MQTNPHKNFNYQSKTYNNHCSKDNIYEKNDLNQRINTNQKGQPNNMVYKNLDNNQSTLTRFFHRFEVEPAMVVFTSFVLLQIFRLLNILITNKTFENFIMIPFQIIVFILPIFLYSLHKSRGNSFGYIKSLRVRNIKAYQLPIAIVSIALLTFGNMLISLVFVGSESLNDGFTLYNMFVSRTDGKFFSILYVILAYALVPAFCEELLFRGLLCREYERYNVLLGIIASSLFFAMLHFDIYLFPVYFFSGLILALTMYATGSLIVSMIVHGAFNLICLFGQSFLNAFYTITGGTQGLFIFILSMLTLLCMALFCTFASKCYKKRAAFSNMKNRKILPPHDKVTHMISKLLLTPFSIASFILYIVVVVVYIFV